MAAVKWSTRKLKDNKVLVIGKARLVCSHTISESAQSRNRTADIERVKQTVSNLLSDKIIAHAKDCQD